MIDVLFITALPWLLLAALFVVAGVRRVVARIRRRSHRNGGPNA